jgi:hypothetical protein
LFDGERLWFKLNGIAVREIRNRRRKINNVETGVYLCNPGRRSSLVLADNADSHSRVADDDASRRLYAIKKATFARNKLYLHHNASALASDESLGALFGGLHGLESLQDLQSENNQDKKIYDSANDRSPKVFVV